MEGDAAVLVLRVHEISLLIPCEARALCPFDWHIHITQVPRQRRVVEDQLHDPFLFAQSDHECIPSRDERPVGRSPRHQLFAFYQSVLVGFYKAVPGPILPGTHQRMLRPDHIQPGPFRTERVGVQKIKKSIAMDHAGLAYAISPVVGLFHGPGRQYRFPVVGARPVHPVIVRDGHANPGDHRQVMFLAGCREAAVIHISPAANLDDTRVASMPAIELRAVSRIGEYTVHRPAAAIAPLQLCFVEPVVQDRVPQPCAYRTTPPHIVLTVSDHHTWDIVVLVWSDDHRCIR